MWYYCTRFKTATLKLSHLLSLITCIIGFSTFGQIDNLYQVDLLTKVNASDLIVTGKVIDQKSYFLPNKTGIETRNYILVGTRFKGLFTSDTLEVITVGGKVGTTVQTTSSLLTLEKGFKGLFMLEEGLKKSSYSVFSSKQGFYRYINGMAICPFVESPISSLESSINSITQITPSFSNAIEAPTTPTLTGSYDFYPNTITAGTDSVLYITGNGFGNLTWADTVNYVSFPNADDGGATYITADSVLYLGWTDTLIQVKVPSKAGSGNIKLTLQGVDHVSLDFLEIPYAIININNEIPVLQDLNGSGGITWSRNWGFTGFGVSDFEGAMEQWVCATGINWTLSTSTVFNGVPNGSDGINLVHVSNLPNGVLGVCYTTFVGCGSGAYKVQDQDIFFDAGTNWNFGSLPVGSFKYDFYSVALHELGHAHLQAHVIHSDNVMKYAIGWNQHEREFHVDNIFGGDYVMNYVDNFNACPVNSMQKLSPSTCTPYSFIDAEISGLDMTNVTCMGMRDVGVVIENIGYDTISDLNLKWTINGVIQPSFVWNGSLANGQVDSLTIGQMNVLDSNYFVEIWVDSVNSALDMNTSNDTLYWDFITDPCAPNNAELIFHRMLDSVSCIEYADLMVDVVNRGTNSINQFKIHYLTNGVLDSVEWTGTLNVGDTLFDFVAFNYFVNNQNTAFEFYIDEVNLALDAYNVNDSASYTYSPKKLGGVYTIGDTLSDFESISEAIRLINQFGICDNVVLNVRSGIYLDKIEIDSIPNLDTNLTVTIQSEAQHRDSVWINSGLGSVYSFSSTQYTIEFNYAKNYIIKDLSFGFSQHFHDRFLYALNSSNLKLDNINVDNKNTYDLSQNENCMIFTTLSPDSNFTTRDIFIKNSRFINGKRILYVGSSFLNTVRTSNIFIENNIIENPTRNVITISGSKNIVIKNNEVLVDEFELNNHLIMEFNKIDSTSLMVEKNLFHLKKNGIFMEMINCSPSSIAPYIFKNNVFSSGTNGLTSNYAIYLQNTNKIHFLNNTINYKLANPNASNPVLYSYTSSSDSITLLNNMISTNGYIFSGVNLERSDFNNLYTTNTSGLGYAQGQNHSSFSAYTTATGLDTNSLSYFPNYVDYVTLYPSNVLLNDKGLTDSIVPLDFKDSVRDLLTPDIGAYEFDTLNYDLRAVASNSQGAIVDCATGSIDVYTKVMNQGAAPVDSFYVFVSLEGTYIDTVLVQQTLLPGTNTGDLLLGNYQVPGSLESSFEITVVLPSLSEVVTSNNSYEFEVRSRLNGDYTVGGIQADFYNFIEASLYLDSVGVCGPVNFNLLDGEHTLIEFNGVDRCHIYPFFGMGPNNPITFQSQAQDSASVLLKIYEVAFVLHEVTHINFKHLTVETLGSTPENFIFFGRSKDINVEQCHLKSAARLGFGIGLSGVNNLNMNIAIKHCNFDMGTRVYSEFTKSGKNIFFDSCVFTRSLLDLNAVDNLNVTNCIFNGAHPLYPTMNYAVMMIQFEDCNNLFFKGNTILNNQTGILLDNCGTADTNRAVLLNNFIRAEEVGIRLKDTDSSYIVHNTVKQMLGTVPINAALRLEGSNPSLIYNNIFQIEAQGKLFSSWNDNFLSSTRIDYNIYYNTDTVFYQDNLETKSYQEWLNTGQDAHSYFALVDFLGADVPHVLNSYQADSSAFVFPWVTDDIDHDLRGAYRDIGADEFNFDYSNFRDIAITQILSPDTVLCNHTDSLILEVYNHGIVTVDSFLLEIYLFDNRIDSMWVYDSIPANTALQLNAGAFYFNQNTWYDFDFKVDLPNGQSDNYGLNNLYHIDYQKIGGMEILYQEISDCSSDYEIWVPQLKNVSYLWENGSTENRRIVTSPGVYSVTITNPEGCIQQISLTLN